MQSCDQDQRVEQRLLRPIAGRGLFRVPLDAHHPGGPLVLLVLDGSLDRLDEPVRAPAGRREPVADAVDALMMVRTAAQRAALGERREPAAGERVDVMRRLRVIHRDAVRERTGQIGEVCVQGAAEGDVHHLHPAADAERRHRRGVGRAHQRDLELVARGIDPVEMSVGLPAVSRRDRRRRHPRAAARPTARARPRRSPVAPAARARCDRPRGAPPPRTGPGRRIHPRASDERGPLPRCR